MKTILVKNPSALALSWSLASAVMVASLAVEAVAQTTGSVCCLPNGGCSLTTRPQCALSGGTFRLAETACTPTVCNGACCTPTPGLDDCIVQSRATCVSAGGLFRGAASNCGSSTCAGACCVPDGQCTEGIIGDLCTGASGEFRGPTSSCAGQTCGGACCDNTGGCRISNTVACDDFHVFHGLGSACADVDCAGACCTSDGDCLEISALNCTEGFGGVFLGLDAVCEGAVCMGACCLPNKGCVETGQGSCVGMLGDFQGRGSSCGDDCPTLMPTSFTYQGQLKREGVPLNGLIDGSFSLWLSPTGDDLSNRILPNFVHNSIEVVNGLFSVELDFGQNAFNGNARWLQVEVRNHNDNDPKPFTTLSPRQALTPAPYALQTRGIVVRNNGNVGIGTKDPAAPLHVRGGENTGVTATLMLTTANGQQTLLLDGNEIDALVNGLFLNHNSDQNVHLVTGGGNVGIGTGFPAARLDVRGEIKLGPSGEFFATSGEENLRIVRGTVNGNSLPNIGSTVQGPGFAATYFGGGDYLITFTRAFSGVPTVTVSNEFDATFGLGPDWPEVDNATATTVNVVFTCYIAGNDEYINCSSKGFHFIAVGPR